MLAANVDALPTGPEWCYEPKWDGWRAVAHRQTDRVLLQSRSGRPLGAYFPEITRAVSRQVPAGVVLDGELIIYQPDRERTSFAALQRRVTAGARVVRMARETPAHYVIFDVLADIAGPVLHLPLADRRSRLRALLEGAPPQLVPCPQTTDLTVAEEWMRTLTALGVEGVVAKRLDGRYQPGRRVWRKLRARTTTEAIIGGVTGALHNPETVQVGRFDAGGRLRYMGRSGTLTPWQRRELAPLLTRPTQQRRGGGINHPWPQPLPGSWSGQFDRPRDVPYIQTEATVVAEIEVDTAYERHRWRHGVHYVAPRRDISVYDVPLTTEAEP
jgi:ATP-dependent DNA ligase